MKWISKNPVKFETVKFIRNELNKNSPINMCKEFHEVDRFAAKLLLGIMQDPSTAPNSRLNPFNPVSVAENLT